MALLSRKSHSFLDARTLSESPNTHLRHYLSLSMLFVLVLSALSVLLAPHIFNVSILSTFHSPLSVAAPAQIHIREAYHPPTCAPLNPQSPKSIKENIWVSLTIEEAVDIRSWLSKPDLGLNLTTASNAKLKYVRYLLDVADA